MNIMYIGLRMYFYELFSFFTLSLSFFLIFCIILRIFAGIQIPIENRKWGSMIGMAILSMAYIINKHFRVEMAKWAQLIGLVRQKFLTRLTHRLWQAEAGWPAEPKVTLFFFKVQ